MKLDVEIVQLIGGRDNQEDCISVFCDDREFFLNDCNDLALNGIETSLIAICDGMGGHAAGEIASEIVSKNFINFFKEYFFKNNSVADSLKISCSLSNQVLSDMINVEPDLYGMGTTLIGAIVSQYTLNWISIGDSHLYLFRDGKLSKLNQDHSMVPVIDAMVARGLLSIEEALVHPDRNALRSVINGENISLIDVGIENFKLLKGDTLVFATDGIDVLTHNRLVKILKGYFWNIKRNIAKRIKVDIENLNLKNNDNATICVVNVY